LDLSLAEKVISSKILELENEKDRLKNELIREKVGGYN